MSVRSLDHLVLTVRSFEATSAFYIGHLGMRRVEYREGRVALQFGHQKINLHPAGAPFQPHAERPLPGSADLWFLVDDLSATVRSLKAAGVEILEGSIERSGGIGPIQFVYVRDPDHNLIELSEPVGVNRDGG